MAHKTLKTKITIRRDHSVAWRQSNPVLLKGELGYDIDLCILKVGDGVTRWIDLSNFNAQVSTNVEVTPRGAYRDDIIPFCTKTQSSNGKEHLQFYYRSSNLQNPTFNSDSGILKAYKFKGLIEPIVLEAGTDLNNIYNAGFYLCDSDGKARTIINVPKVAAFSLLCEKSTGGAHGLIQTIKIYYKSQVEYRRVGYNGTWYPWEQVWSSSEGASKSRISDRLRMDYISSDSFHKVALYWIDKPKEAFFLKGKKYDLQYNSSTNRLKVGGVFAGRIQSNEVLLANGETVEIENTHAHCSSQTCYLDRYPLRNDAMFPKTEYYTVNTNDEYTIDFGSSRKYADNTVVVTTNLDKCCAYFKFNSKTHCTIPRRIKSGPKVISTNEVPANYQIVPPHRYVENSVINDKVGYDPQNPGGRIYSTTNFSYTYSYDYCQIYADDVQFYVYKDEPLIFKWFCVNNQYYFRIISN